MTKEPLPSDLRAIAYSLEEQAGPMTWVQRLREAADEIERLRGERDG